MTGGSRHKWAASSCAIVFAVVCCAYGAEARAARWHQLRDCRHGHSHGGRRLAQTSTTATVSNGQELVAALGDPSVTTIALTGNIVRLARQDLQQVFGGTVDITGSRTVNVSSANPDQPVTLDFGGLCNAIHVDGSSTLNFINIVAQGFASQYQPCAKTVTTRIVGQGSWPTLTGDSGSSFGGFNVTVYSLLPDCSTFSTSTLAQARQGLGNDSVSLLGPSTIFITNGHALRLPIINRATNVSLGYSTTRFDDAVSICFTDNYAPGNALPAVSGGGGGGTAWWVWLLVALACVAVVGFAVLLLLVCLRRRQVAKAAAEQGALPPPLPKGSEESMDTATLPSATAKSAMEQRILSSAFQSLAANSVAANNSLEASSAETALLEAWRNRQLSTDSAADEVELGPMIGRGGFGQVHKARWRGALVAVKIVNHAPGKEQIRDIRVLRETLFSTALLHPNIVVTYRIITIPTPDPLRQRSTSTGSGGFGSRSSGGGRSSATASNPSGGATIILEQLREEGILNGGGGGGGVLSDRAMAFVAASAAAEGRPPGQGPAAEAGRRQPGPAQPGQLQPGGQQPGGHQHQQQQQQQQQPQGLRAGSAPDTRTVTAERTASGRFASASVDDTARYRKRTLSVRVDPESAIDEEKYIEGELEALAETWMLMEYCDRGSLEKGLQNGLLRLKDGRICLTKLYKTLIDIAAGMQYLHSAKILHGDLKLGNILLKSTATDMRGFLCKICDFGMSRLMDATKTHVSTSSMGTISYQPPELLCGQGLSPAVDVYSFGVIMYELFTGETAFQGANLGHLIFQIVHKRERPPIPDDCPAEYRELMAACWQHEPSQRPSFQAVLAALQAQYSALRAANPLRTTSAPARSGLQATPTAGEPPGAAAAPPAGAEPPASQAVGPEAAEPQQAEQHNLYAMHAEQAQLPAPGCAAGGPLSGSGGSR